MLKKETIKELKKTIHDLNKMIADMTDSACKLNRICDDIIEEHKKLVKEF